MSRIGKKPILIPEGIEIKIEKNEIKVKGPKGVLEVSFSPLISVQKKDKEIIVSAEKKSAGALWGLTRASIQNMIEGVAKGFEKQLEIQGVGYKCAVQGKKLILNIGFSHPVELEVPQDLDVATEKNIITVKGIDKQKVGQFAAKIREKRPPEPYKGKGIRYVGEKVKIKEGKKAVTATA